MLNSKFRGDNLVLAKDIGGILYSLQPAFFFFYQTRLSFFAGDTILLNFQSYQKLNIFYPLTILQCKGTLHSLDKNPNLEINI